MYNFRQSFVLHAVRKAASTDDFVVRFPPFQYGATLTITAFSISNDTTGTKVATVGVKRSEVEHWLESVALTTATYFYTNKNEIVVPSDWNPIVKVLSPTSGDVYTFNVFGYLDIPMAQEVKLGVAG